MSIKFKLLLSYVAMIIIPVILTAIAAGVIFSTSFEDGDDKYAGRDMFMTMAQDISSTYLEIEHTILDNPEKLKDKKYLATVDDKLKESNLGIVIFKTDGSLIFSSKFLKDAGAVEYLVKSGDPNPYNSHENHRDNNYATLMEQKLTLSDNSSVKVYLIADFKPIGDFFGKYFAALGIAVLIILLVTNVALTILVSRSIIKPLRLLKYGADQIKDGNLEFEIKTRKKDEIGDVLEAFEQMRCRLKGSIETQLQFEENRKELISSISHDLKTPVTSIKGYVEGIMDGVADTQEKMDKYVKTIYSKANDLDRLIDDLFLFSKLDLKKLPYNFEKVDIIDYLKDCADELSVDLEKRDVKLGLSIEADENVFVMADREKLKRVIVNIVENSVKFEDKDEKKIDIRLVHEGDCVIIRIRDNGRGIKEEELVAVFERFYRTDSSRNSSTGGSGLGLAIAKQIIEGHEGRIWAESTFGVETIISFTLKTV